MIDTPIIAAINHLLSEEPVARTQLARHAGKTVLFDAGAVQLRLLANADGKVQAVGDEVVPNVTIRASLSDLPLILANRAHAFSYVRIEGDADFANTVSQLSETLQWDAEGDLARFIGDAPALRLTEAAKATVQGAQQMRRKIEENFAEYFLEENPMLVRHRAVAHFSAEVTQLRDDVERLQKRIEKLKGSR